MKFLVLFAQQHVDFRCAELRALAQLYDISLDLSGYSDESPYMELELPSEEHAIQLVSRSILVRYIYKIYSQGKSMEEIHSQNKRFDFSEMNGRSFRFEFETYFGTRDMNSQRHVFNDLAYLDDILTGPVKMKNPDVSLVFVEHYDRLRPTDPPLYIWFGRLVAKSGRSAMDEMDLKKRRNVGTTSFDAELSLVTANIAHTLPGGFVLDPFAGTGSFPLAAAHFGSIVFATDIDFRSLTGYEGNFDQYHLSHRLAVCAEMDFTHNAIRPLEYNAIICDPPYGVRERSVMCGAAKPEKFAGKENVIVKGVLAHRRRSYCATKKPYPIPQLFSDLMEYAANHLSVAGRLAMWIPVDYEKPPPAVPQHKLLKYIDRCVQRFGKWERWLLVYQRREPGDVGDETALTVNIDFRDYYMRPKVQQAN